CYLEDGASKGAWLNRSSIIFAGGDKWSVDPRVSISTLNKRDYSLQIQNVDVTDDGPYTCSVQTQHTPRTMQVHLTVQEYYGTEHDITVFLSKTNNKLYDNVVPKIKFSPKSIYIQKLSRDSRGQWFFQKDTGIGVGKPGFKTFKVDSDQKILRSILIKTKKTNDRRKN
ncbi:hypothetical protein FD755_003080, partial [Muntiacus reevesi]